MENTFSPLDPLGPEFGKVQGPAINAQSLSPFEGDVLKENKIDFFPIAHDFSIAAHPKYPVQDVVTGRSPNRPGYQNPNKNLTAQQRADAWAADSEMMIRSHNDKNTYAKMNMYNAGPSGNSFYKRYAAFGEKKFNELGFSPMRDNEAIYNANTTWGERASRMMKNSFLPLLGRGFVSGPKSLFKMMQGDFSSDLEDARAYEEAAAIGQDTSGGFGAFFTNTSMSFAYTAGIIGEAIVEEVAGALLAPVTFGGSFFAATANNLRKVGKLGDAVDLAVDGYRAVNTTLKEANSINGARKMWKGAETFGNNKLVKFLNPLENTYSAVMGIGKNADNLTGLARLSRETSKTAGGLFRDVRNINMALSEARLEGGMNDNKVYDELYDEYYRKNERAPSDEEQYEMTKTAKASGINTLMWNTALIFASNKIVLPNLMKSGAGKNAIGNKLDDVLTMKDGKVVLEKKFDAGKKIAKGEFTYVANSFKNSLKGFKAAPIRTTAKVAGTYLKGNLLEGVQENLQDVISVANEEYYINSYKNKELGAHLYNKSQSSLMLDGLKNQFSSQGFETFASGALMGLFSGGLNLIKGGLDAGYNNIFNKEEYNTYKAERKTHGENVAKQLTALYNDPNEFFDPKLFNYGNQNNVVANTEDADTKDKKDDLRDAFMSQVWTSLSSNTLNYFKDHISSFKDVTPEEFEDAFGFEKGTGIERQGKIDTIISKIDDVKKTYDYASDRFPNPIDLSKYDKALPEYREAALLSRAWNEGVRQYVFSNHKYMDNVDRMVSISGTILDNPSMKKMSQTDMQMILQPSKINDEVQLLKSEIEGLSQLTDSKSKAELLKKQNKVTALEEYASAHNMHEAYYNSSTRDQFINDLFEEVKKQQGVAELTEDDKKQILEIQENAVDNDLELAYKNFLKVANGIDSSYIFDTDVDESFSKLKDHYKIDEETKDLVKQINLMHDPKFFMGQVNKSKVWMTNMYNNRKDYFVDMVNKQINGLENNTFLNALADKNIFMDLEEFQNYMDNNVPPKEFLNDTTKQVIKPGTIEYALIFDMLQKNKELKTQETSKETFEEKLQTVLDGLDIAEQKEIDKLEKTEVKTKVKTVKREGIKIKDVAIEIALGEYVDITIEKTDQVLTLFSSAEGLRNNNKDGDVISIKDIKDTFSEYTIYKLELKPNAAEVKEINKKYTDLKKEAIDKFKAEKSKNELKQYSIYTELKDFPKDLYKELQAEFNKSEELAAASDEDLSDEEILDMFKAFIEKDANAKTIIDNYNGKNAEEVKKEESGEIEEFDFQYNNKTENTSKFDNEQIKTLSSQFKNFRDSETDPVKKEYYAKVVNDFKKLIATRLLKSYKPDIQETIRIIKEKLTDQQGRAQKIGQLGYLVNNKILERVTNFIQGLKSNKYKYTGKQIITNAFDITINKTGLNKESIDAFMTEIDEKLMPTPTKDTGYTKDTLDGVASTSNNLRNYLNDILENKETNGLKSKKDQLDAIQKYISDNAYEYTRKAGDYLDEQLKSFFTKGEKPEFKESEIIREAFDDIFGPKGFLKPIKQKIDSGELYVLAKNLVVFDEESGIAGEMDLLLIDKQGKLHIVDFKTGEQKKWNGFVEGTDSGLNKTEDYTLQQYTYARLLKKMTGLDAEINIMPIEININKYRYQIGTVNEPTNKKLLGLDNWYFPLDPNFADAKTKIDKEISITEPVITEPVITEPGIKVATEVKLSDEDKTKLGRLGYKSEFYRQLSKEDLTKILQDSIPIEVFTKEQTITEEKQVTKVSELTFKNGDTVIVEKTIPGRKNDPDFASVGAVITVIETTEKGVRFTYMGRQKTLSLSELDKYVTTKTIEKTKEAEKGDEVLDAIDQDLIAESLKVLKDFISSDTNINKAKTNANDKTLVEIYDELLKYLDC
jgi:hypothetical protein